MSWISYLWSDKAKGIVKKMIKKDKEDEKIFTGEERKDALHQLP